MTSYFVLLAAKGHEPPPIIDIDYTVVVQFGIFIMLLLVLSRFVFRPWLEIHKERSENIEGAREQAGTLDSEADEKFTRYEEKISYARKDAAKVRARVRGEGEERANEILGDARHKTEAKIERARQRTAKSIEKAEVELRRHADEVAKAMASKLLGREV